MSRSINKVILVGNTGSDPEVRTTPGGTKLAKVSLATTRSFKDRSGERQEKTEWHRLTFWDRLADIAEQYLHKGDRVYVEGRIEYSTSEHEGQTRHWTEIVAQELILLGGAGERDAAPAGRSAPRQSAPAPSPFDDDDDLPFS